MQYFNVHRSNIGKLQDLLNDHTARGWTVHHIRGVSTSRGDASHLLVLFVRDFADTEARVAYEDARAARHGRQHVAVAPAPVTP